MLRQYIFFQKISATLTKHRFAVIVAIIFIVVIGTMSLGRHYTFQTQTWDMATFDQSMWNTLRGNFMFNNFEGTNHFAIHFSPFLILLLPFYALWQSPYILLALQTIAVGLSIIPVYLLARDYVSPFFSKFITVMYACYPSLAWVALFDFHPVAFAIPCIAAAIYCITRNRYALTAVFLVVTSLTEENMIIAAMFIGLYVFLFKNRRVGFGILTASIIYFIIVAKLIMPWFGGSIARLDRYAELGDSMTSIIKTLITDPRLVADTIFTTEKMRYIVGLVWPVAFLPLLAWPMWILMLPGLAQNLLTNRSFQFETVYHYDSIIVPFIGVAIVYGLTAISKVANKYQKLTAVLLTIFLLSGFLALSPLSPKNPDWARYHDTRTADFRAILSLIPSDASVAAHTNLVPHLSHRDSISMTGKETDFAEYVILDSHDLFGFASQGEFDRYLDAYRQTNAYKIAEINKRYFLLIRQ